MNYNKMFRPKIIENYPLCKRSKIDTGYRCNEKCYFCYYKSNLDDPVKDFELIKKDILSAKLAGATSVDFSGGESSIHPKFIDMIKYAVSLDMKICTLTNGSVLIDGYLLKCYNAGLSEILFSLHGWDKLSHNRKVGSLAFDNIINSIKQSLDMGIFVRINCTVDKDFNEVKYVRLIKTLNIKQLNMLPLNHWDDADRIKPVNYQLISEKMKYIIDELKHKVNEINVRYMPFCHMINYEKYIVGTYQHIYDIKDWNILLYKKFEKFDEQSMYDEAFINRNFTYKKDKECLSCKYMMICDGIEKQNLTKPIQVEGDMILDINHYRK